MVFAGHFSIGEILKETQLDSIKDGLKRGGTLAILVNDLDFTRKLRFYQAGGKELVITHYGRRKRCGTTAPLCRLPEFKEIPKIIDWKMYEQALKAINKEQKGSMEEVVRREIVQKCIKKRLLKYKLKPEAVRIYTERELRNLAGKRLTEKRKKMASWIPLLKKINMIDKARSSISGIPLCGGILLALYERVSKEGYGKIIQLDDESERKANEEGERMCKTLHHAFPEDSRWKLSFESKYYSPPIKDKQ